MTIAAICDKCDRKSYLMKAEVWRFMAGSLLGWRLGKDGYTGEDICENCQHGIDPDREAAPADWPNAEDRESWKRLALTIPDNQRGDAFFGADQVLALIAHVEQLEAEVAFLKRNGLRGAEKLLRLEAERERLRGEVAEYKDQAAQRQESRLQRLP